MAVNHQDDLAAELICNFFASTTENGVQDKKSLQACYTYFDKMLTKKHVKRPILLITDGQSSQFSVDAMSFLFSKETLGLFLGPPDI